MNKLWYAESAIIIDKCLHEARDNCLCHQKLDECFFGGGGGDIVIGSSIFSGYINPREAIDD